MTRLASNPFEAARIEAHEALASTVTRALSKKGYEAVFAPTKEDALTTRSEERRVGKECRSRWSPYH